MDSTFGRKYVTPSHSTHPRPGDGEATPAPVRLDALQHQIHEILKTGTWEDVIHELLILAAEMTSAQSVGYFTGTQSGAIECVMSVDVSREMEHDWVNSRFTRSALPP